MIIHLGTRVECVFGKTDENGNVIEQIPVGAGTSYLTPEAFEAIREHLLAEKAKLETAPVEKENDDATATVCA